MGERSIADILDAAADLIEPEGAWTQGHIRRDAKGKYTALPGHAVCWCTVGATLAVAGLAASMSADRFLASFLGLDGVDAVEQWNDAPERTQAEVVAKLREAAALARTKEAEANHA